MTVERWRMMSGRVASVDLSGHPDAVQGARELLRMNGATRIDESAEKACNRCGAMLSNDGGMAWFHPNGLIMCDPLQAYAGDEYDGDRRLRAEQRSALRAAATAAEGENQNSGENRS